MNHEPAPPPQPEPSELDRKIAYIKDHLRIHSDMSSFYFDEVLTALADARQDSQRLRALWSETTVELLAERKKNAEFTEQVAYLQSLLRPIEDSEAVAFRDWQESERLWKEIEAKTPQQIEADLLAAGYTKEMLAEGLARVRQTVEKALAARTANVCKEEP